MNLTGRQLLILLELHAVYHGSVDDVCYIECSTGRYKNDDPLGDLESMRLVKIGPRDIDQSNPVKLTRLGKRTAKAMTEAAEATLRGTI
jgi:hypothetical protein